MFDYKLLEALACVIHEKGFDKAAKKLHITQSAVSQRIRLLEDQAGQVLVTRQVPPRVTPAGMCLLKHTLQVKHLEADLEQTMAGADQKGFTVFSVGINADSLATWFLPAVKAFLSANRILLDLNVDDQDETRKMLKNGEVSGCISSEQSPVQGCSVTPIGAMTYRLAASKPFVDRYFPEGLTEEAIQKAPSVIFNRRDDLHDTFLKSYFKQEIQSYPIHYVPSSEQFANMIKAGVAYGMIPDLQGRDHIRSGALVDLAPSCPVWVSLFWHRWNLKSDLLDAFSRAIVKNAVIC